MVLDYHVNGLLMHRFQVPEIGTDPIQDGAFALQTIANAPVPPAVALHTGIQTGAVLALAVAPALSKQIGVEPVEHLVNAWGRWYGHDVDALRAQLDAAAPPPHLTPDDLVEGM